MSRDNVEARQGEEVDAVTDHRILSAGGAGPRRFAAYVTNLGNVLALNTSRRQTKGHTAGNRRTKQALLTTTPPTRLELLSEERSCAGWSLSVLLHCWAWFIP